MSKTKIITVCDEIKQIDEFVLSLNKSMEMMHNEGLDGHLDTLKELEHYLEHARDTKQAEVEYMEGQIAQSFEREGMEVCSWCAEWTRSVATTCDKCDRKL
ncbi:MAG: hypothetical protein C9356_19765 [Oleiphilus sp.]|nr:MAG: hypothetical protein C9356_19765 [Oleiphilus sp.]